MVGKEPLTSNENNELSYAIAQDAGERKKSIKELFFKYWSYSILFVLSIVICLSLNYIYIHFRTLTYKSSIRVLLKEDGKGGAGGGGGQDLGLASILLSNKPNLATEVEILKSTSLMRRVVERLNLNTVSIYMGKVKNTEIYDRTTPPVLTFVEIGDSSKVYRINLEISGNKLYYYQNEKKQPIKNLERVSFNGCTFIVNVDNRTETEKIQNYSITWYPSNQIASLIASKITPAPLTKEASILLISHSSILPNKSRDILNTLVREYEAYNIEEKNKTVDNTLQFIDDRLRLISQDLGGVENNLLHFKESNDALDLKAQTLSGLTKADVLKAKLDEVEIKKKVADMLSDYVNNSQRRFNLIPSNLGMEDITLIELVKMYNEDVSKRQELLKTIPNGNLAVLTIESELDQLRSKILENIKNIKSTYNVAFLSTNDEYQKVVSDVKQIPRKEKDILDIERQQQIKEKLYVYLLEKREESAISKAGAVSNSKPIDEAVTDNEPIGSTNSILYTIAFLCGIGLPLVIILLRELLNDKIITREDIQQNSKVPIIGEVSHLNENEKAIVANSSRGVLPEQFRLIRTNLRYFFGEKELNAGVILVTSTMKGEGKSFVSMNLGAILAVGGKKTIILEFDIRKPRVTKALGMINDKGISTFLIGNSKIEEIIRPIEGIDNYWLLSSGPIPPNPAELILLEDKMTELFSELSKRFDYIIVDSAPIGIVSDSRVLSKYSNLNLYIVRQKFTLKNQIKFLDNLYVNRILPNMALIVNDVVGKGADSYYGYGAGNYLYGGYYGYSYGYGYGYSYNYGYESDKEKEVSKGFFGWIKNLF